MVEGERKQETEEKGAGYYHSERSYGKLHRIILLPEGAKTDQTAAQFNNGVLKVSVPIPEAKAAALGTSSKGAYQADRSIRSNLALNLAGRKAAVGHTRLAVGFPRTTGIVPLLVPNLS